MGGRHHAAGPIGDVIVVWVGSNIIEELVDGSNGVLSGGHMLSADGAEEIL